MRKFQVMKILLLSVTLSVVVLEGEKITRENMPAAKYYDGKKFVIPIAHKTMEDIRDRWLQQAMSGLITGVSLKKLGKSKNEWQVFSSNKHHNQPNGDEWIGGFHVSRAKRSDNRKANIISQNNYKLLTENTNRSPFGFIAQFLKKNMQYIKKKTDSKPWFAVVAEAKQLEAELKKHDALKRGLRRKLKLLSEARTKELSLDERRELNNPDILPMEGDFENMPLVIEDKLRANGKSGNIKELMKLARQGISLGMSLAGKNTTSFGKKVLRVGSPRFFSLVPDDDSDDTVNLLSPSLLNMHDKGNDAENLVSIPKLLKTLRSSKFKDHEDLLNLIFEASGISDHLKKAKIKNICLNFNCLRFVNFCHTVQMPLLMFKEKLQAENLKNARGIDGQPLYFTKENVTEMFGDFEKHKIETFEKLHKTFTNQQKADLNDTGLTTLTREQLFLIYGKDSPYQDLATLHRLTNITNDDHLQKLIMDDIHAIAKSKNIAVKKGDRHKRQVVLSPAALSVSVLRVSRMTPVILSPAVLSPSVLSPSILGPVILSPGLFNPSFLSPRLLGPVILSPGGFGPLILSPVALSPAVLSPGIFGPAVLSPTALNPSALNPGFGSPAVLSPFILNPGLLNPSALSPLVLSPFAFSPSILSPSFFSAVILSPNAFSPGIASPSQNVTVLFSPSFFS
ncbi:unnamed protein product [Dracunculus medinensis]|uniref:ANK_REP_REGION domain-containing protein n=1 Tax=Dracunculus medinensis TaxID=318479 RepID=A0A0N4U3A8_DRAME|nr:unnamed protein product [Dracunculus medinensis]